MNGQDILKSLSPTQQVIKIVNEELIALMGSAAKYNTANVKAYLEMDWSARESRIIMNEIFPNLVGVPDMPGSYIIGRYVNFAFLAAYNEKASPSDGGCFCCKAISFLFHLQIGVF